MGGEPHVSIAIPPSHYPHPATSMNITPHKFQWHSEYAVKVKRNEIELEHLNVHWLQLHQM